MKSLEYLIPSNLAAAIGETFMHSLWQLAGVAILMALVLAFVNRKASATRYRIGTVALALMVIFPMTTFFLVYEPAAETTTSLSSTIESGISQLAFIPVANSEMTLMEQVGEFFNQNAYLIMGLWLIGALFFTLRFTGSYLQVRRLKRKNTSPAPAEAVAMLRSLIDRMGIRRAVTLLQSSQVDTPMVIGAFKPVILVPMGLFAGLTTEQVECVLAHELAHVRRWDFFVNILQSMVEIALFYHPAMWWITKMVREERENCCDQIVVDLKENRLVYAKALLNLEVLRSKRPALAMGANGGKLFQRIQRITGGEPRQRRPQSRSIFLAIFSLCLVLMLTTTTKEQLQASIPYFNFLPPELQFVADQTDDGNTEEIASEEVSEEEEVEEVDEVDVFDGDESTIVLDFEEGDEFFKAKNLPLNFGMSTSEDGGHNFIFRTANLVKQLKASLTMGIDSPITQIVMVEDGEEVRISFDGNGKISRVIKNGAEVPSSDYGSYEEMVAKAMGKHSGHHGDHHRVVVRGRAHSGDVPPMPPMPDVNVRIPPMPPMPSLNLKHLKELPPPPPPPSDDSEAAKRKHEKAMERYEEEVERWAEEFEAKFDEGEWEAYGEAMEEWGEKIGQNFNEEEWEEYGEQMEAWGESFGKNWEEFGEELAEKFEHMELDGMSEEIEEEVEREIERAMRTMERELERAERDRERVERRREEVEIERHRRMADEERDMADRYMNGMDRLKRSLDRDGLVDEGDSFKLKISEDEMYLNGDRQARSIQEKYLHIIHSMGIEGEGNEWIEINYKKGKTKIEN